MSTTTIHRTSVANPTDGGHGRLRRLIRGTAQDPSWYRPLLLALLAATAIAYIVNLTASGDANSFYAAAVQAGTKSWKAFFFGSLDASNFITVDKPPASLWVMELSGRIFGFSSASMLIPQVLEGVISISLLVSAVKRWFGPSAGLIAGVLLAVTPVAALMFGFNDPDPLMVTLVMASAYCLVRSVEKGSTKWMLGVGACLGFAFLAKMMEAFLVVPGFALVYMIAAPVSVKRRIGQLLAGFTMMIASAGWWVAIVALWPAADRPMIDGTTDNSILNLIWDYNGFGRLTGSGGGGPGGGSGGGIGSMFSGSAGPLRLFDDLMGSQASWFIPPALVVLVVGLIWRWHQPRTDRMRAGLLIFGTWLLVAGLTFSLSKGTIHTYYTILLAPAIAALVGIGAAQLWKLRERLAARGLMAFLVAITAGWAVVLLQRDSGWQPWLTPLVIVAGVAAIAGLLIPSTVWPRNMLGKVMGATAVLAALACLAGPVAYSAQTISTAHSGSAPSAGPSSSSSGGFGGGFGGSSGGSRGGFSGLPTGKTGGPPSGITGSLGAGKGAAGKLGSAFSGGSAGGMGAKNAKLDKLLEASSSYRWAAATSGSQTAATLELDSDGSAVMAIGGFSGSGGDLTLAQFEKYVKAHDIHYYVVSSNSGPGGFSFGATTTGSTSSSSGSSGLSSLFGDSSSSTQSTSGTTGGASGSAFSSTSGTSGARTGGPGGSSASTKILAWVKAHYTSETVGGTTVYNLANPK